MVGDRMTGDGRQRYVVQAAEAVDLDDVGCFCVALAENEEGEGLSLAFTIPTNGYTEQDVELGQATYSVSDGVGRTAYGGVSSWSSLVSSSEITITLEPDVAQLFELPEILELTVEVERSKFTEIVQGLARVLNG